MSLAMYLTFLGDSDATAKGEVRFVRDGNSLVDVWSDLKKRFAQGALIMLLYASVSNMSTSDKRVKVEHLISKRTHKLIALRFLVRVWCLSCLWGCSGLDVDGPPSSPQRPNSGIRAPGPTKGTTKATG
ncbi:hypothetical protein MTR_7g062170 [Medicago truncatula]|uniref:Uncharacterized protein n=1 Tax=Medicago truncatula TaxID=3880 RepID=A0A072UAR3_MEDTR|nr:hypothetical protein MTR_7g062170 [Medicago truncatula]